jgi:hypothetical protein
MGRAIEGSRTQRLHVITPDPTKRLLLPRSVKLEVESPPGRRDHGLRGLAPPLNDVAYSYPRLEWDPPTTENAEQGPQSPPLSGCVWDFAQLDGDDPEELASFARRWGVLGICNHLRPCAHRPDCAPLGLRIGRTERGRNWEPLAPWVALIAQCRAMLDLTQATQASVDPDPAAVDTLEALWPRAGRDPRLLVRIAVNQWLDWAAAGLRVDWGEEEDTPTFRFIPYREDEGDLAGTIFDYVAVWLVAAVTSTDGLYRCEICGRTFPPEGRRPRIDRAVYCGGCKAEGRRATKRKWWRHRPRA